MVAAGVVSVVIVHLRVFRTGGRGGGRGRPVVADPGWRGLDGHRQARLASVHHLQLRPLLTAAKDVLLGSELSWELLRVRDSHLRHQPLLFGRSGLAGGLRDLDRWRGIRSNRHPSMQLGAEEVGLLGQKDLRAFNLPKIEPHSRDFRGSQAEGGIGVGAHKSPKFGCTLDDSVKTVHLVRDERKIRNLRLPFDQVLQLGPGRVTGYLDSVVADGTGVLVIFLDLSTRDLEAFSMIPTESVSQRGQRGLHETDHSWQTSHSIIIPASGCLQMQKTSRCLPRELSP